ncbi:MAG: glucokinase [Candidatus Polarisedimenticolaceae bacterium]|nr:glucokinase [Candidatus Polarisedimenticolaceae bacterium]
MRLSPTTSAAWEDVCKHTCFGIAGPIKNRCVKTTNLPWQVNAADLEHGVRITKVWLTNDLEAVV